MHTLYIDDRERWNTFVASSRYGHILQSWEWGELKRRQGWAPLRVALTADGSIRAAAQVLVRRLPYGFGRIAYVPRGPAVDFADRALVAELLAALRGLAAERDVISLKIEPEALDGPVAAELAALGLEPAPPVQMRSSIWVDVSASDDELLARQKQKTRYNIRLAAKKGVTVSRASVDGLDDWYRMYEVTARRDGFVIHDLEYYRSILEILEPRDMAALLLAHHDGDLLAGIIVFAFGAKAQYMYGASGNQKRNLMAPYLLQWEGMRWARERGARIYDLWGIPDRLEENEELWGVYRHKRGYGGEIVRYAGAFDMIQTPIRHFALERIARPLFKRVSRMTA
jgi:lipid II:glycine glycyltransferase (peptidoglycan interpeptide bridge formation enzyme)